MVTGNPFWLCHSGEVFTLRDPQLSSRVKWRGQTLLCVTLGSCVKIEKDTMCKHSLGTEVTKWGGGDTADFLIQIFKASRSFGALDPYLELVYLAILYQSLSDDPLNIKGKPKLLLDPNFTMNPS